jgi:hypothetical protein
MVKFKSSDLNASTLTIQKLATEQRNPQEYCLYDSPPVHFFHSKDNSTLSIEEEFFDPWHICQDCHKIHTAIFETPDPVNCSIDCLQDYLTMGTKRKLRTAPARKRAPKASNLPLPPRMEEEPTRGEEPNEVAPPVEARQITMEMRMQYRNLDHIPEDFNLEALPMRVHLSSRGGLNLTHGGAAEHQVLRNGTGDLAPFNEPNNHYGKKIFGYILKAFGEQPATGGLTNENLAREVIKDEMEHICQVANVAYYPPPDRVVTVIYKTLVGFSAGTPYNYPLRELGAIFMEIRVGDNPMNLHEMPALVEACNIYYQNMVKDTKGLPNMNQMAWRVILIKLLNGHLVNCKVPPVPFDVSPRAAAKANQERVNDGHAFRAGMEYTIDTRPDVINAYRKLLEEYHQQKIKDASEKIHEEIKVLSPDQKRMRLIFGGQVDLTGLSDDDSSHGDVPAAGTKEGDSKPLAKGSSKKKDTTDNDPPVELESPASDKKDEDYKSNEDEGSDSGASAESPHKSG